MDRDTVTGKRQFEKILYGLREASFDILRLSVMVRTSSLMLGSTWGD